MIYIVLMILLHAMQPAGCVLSVISDQASSCMHYGAELSRINVHDQ